MGSYLTGAIRKNGRREGTFSCQGVELIWKEVGFGRILAQDRLYDSGIAEERRQRMEGTQGSLYGALIVGGWKI
jgi:hypothetical protein